MRIIVTLLILKCSFTAFGQIKTEPVSTTAVPKNISFQGRVVQALRYQDATGTYLALLTQTGIKPQPGSSDSRQKNLYAYHFRLQDKGTPIPNWQLHDGVQDCVLDVAASFVPGAFAVTDLDRNGTAEVWVMYRTACHGDVSPSDLKIIMHEGTTKYAVCGVGKLKVGNQLQPDGGTYQLDAGFAHAPAAFRQYALQLWKKYQTESL